jgi:hypothetical protein
MLRLLSASLLAAQAAVPGITTHRGALRSTSTGTAGTSPAPLVHPRWHGHADLAPAPTTHRPTRPAQGQRRPAGADRHCPASCPLGRRRSARPPGHRPALPQRPGRGRPAHRRRARAADRPGDHRGDHPHGSTGWNAPATSAGLPTPRPPPRDHRTGARTAGLHRAALPGHGHRLDRPARRLQRRAAGPAPGPVRPHAPDIAATARQPADDTPSPDAATS